MNKELYFIAILHEALKADDVKPALIRAFSDINELGKTNEYKEGFANFQSFIKEVYQRHLIFKKDYIAQVMLDLVDLLSGQTPRGNAVAIHRALWSEQYRQFQGIASGLEMIVSEIIILSDNQQIGSIGLDKNGRNRRLEGILPGTYTVKLSTGRVLWKDRLTDTDLIIAMTFGSENIKLAADTENLEAKPVRLINIMDGRVVLKIFAGLNNGSIEVELN